LLRSAVEDADQDAFVGVSHPSLLLVLDASRCRAVPGAPRGAQFAQGFKVPVVVVFPEHGKS